LFAGGELALDEEHAIHAPPIAGSVNDAAAKRRSEARFMTFLEVIQTP
jgi:hypothetical protein